MPGGVRSRQPWLYLGADWAASDILGPEREAGGRRRRREEGGRSVSGRGRGERRGEGGLQEKTDSKNREREVMAVVEEKSEKKAKKAAVRSGDKCLSKKKRIPKRNIASANNNLSLSNRRGTEREDVIEREKQGEGEGDSVRDKQTKREREREKATQQ